MDVRRDTAGIRTNIAVLERELGGLTYRLSKATPTQRRALEARRVDLMEALDHEHARLNAFRPAGDDA